MARVLITGTSKGIGYDATLLLARAGHDVVATMRNPGDCDLEKVASEAKLPVTVLRLDVDDDASVVEVFGKVGDSIDVLVNNARIYSINAVEDESLDAVPARDGDELLRCRALHQAGAPGNAEARLGLHHQRDFDRRAHRLLGEQRLRGIEVRPGGVYRVPGPGGQRPWNQGCPGGARHHRYRHGHHEPAPVRQEHDLPPRASAACILHQSGEAEASPTLVGEMIRYVIEGHDPRLRFPVGPDVLSFLGWRDALSDENHWFEYTPRRLTFGKTNY